MRMISPPRIKFCGITRLEDAEYAVGLGAWAVGMILWAGSPRVVLPQEAADIADALRRRAEIVGVFVNEELDALVTLADEIGLTMVQLHGDEGPAYAQTVARRTGAKVIKATRVRDGGDITALRPFSTDFHLLDSYVPGTPGGTGESFAWELAGRRRGGPPVILSGGLTPDNVAEAAQIVAPFGVDVCSGVESAPGIKDHDRMDAFVAALAPAEVSP
ncbi:phosphoribosylanthranilate isomerase [Conexibacter sp. DBS9H8]|uniref:phosphoribosylanthranilate isomerase n=1 Tax=Conexibacter sp. DBS9H8 TaxID=2937801 RepID=UPI0020109E7A|nr:phosphoribosylanthranilate isomerase [Conexibacter sp. DBS9H8]